MALVRFIFNLVRIKNLYHYFITNHLCKLRVKTRINKNYLSKNILPVQLSSVLRVLAMHLQEHELNATTIK